MADGSPAASICSRAIASWAARRVAGARLSLPSDTSFDSYERALAHVTGAPLPADIELVANQALVDVLLEYPMTSAESRISISTRFETAGLRSVTVLRFRPGTSDGRSRSSARSSSTATPGLVRLDPRWFQAASRFVVDGFFHILGGVDHLLFLLCLVIPFRRLGALVVIVTSFTVAHSVTLIASAYDMAPSALWFPPLVETLIAASIVYMAIENIVSPALRTAAGWSRLPSASCTGSASRSRFVTRCSWPATMC